MDRRGFLGAGLTAGLSLTGIAFTQMEAARTAPARAAGLATAGAPSVGVTRERGLPTWPLFEWQQPGGSFRPGQGTFQPPPLAIYRDDTAYADVASVLKIPPIWVSTLRTQALAVLTDPADLARNPARPAPADQPDDLVRVRTDDGDFLSVRLAGWQDGDPRHAYPPQLRELYQQAMGIRRHVRNAGRPWQPTGVLVAVVALDDRPEQFRPWPEALPGPANKPYQELRLPGGPAGLARATTGSWPCYRHGRNQYLAATWRPLLPHEIT